MKIRNEKIPSRLSISRALAELHNASVGSGLLSAEEAFSATLDVLALLRLTLSERHWVFGPTLPELIVGDSISSADMDSADFSFIDEKTVKDPNLKRDRNFTLISLIDRAIQVLRSTGLRYCSLDFSFNMMGDLYKERRELEKVGTLCSKLSWTQEDRDKLARKFVKKYGLPDKATRMAFSQFWSSLDRSIRDANREIQLTKPQKNNRQQQSRKILRKSSRITRDLDKARANPKLLYKKRK